MSTSDEPRCASYQYPNTIGRPVRQPPTRCSYCHGMRVTAIRDRRLGSIGPRSVCADCYQREEGRPWVEPPAVQPPPPLRVVPPPAPVQSAPRARRARGGKFGPDIGAVRWALLTAAATGRRAEWLAAHAGRVARTQAARMVTAGWITADGQITPSGWMLFLDELDHRGLLAAGQR